MTLISLLILVLVLGLIYWVISELLPEPFRKVALVILVIIFILYLLPLAGLPGLRIDR